MLWSQSKLHLANLSGQGKNGYICAPEYEQGSQSVKSFCASHNISPATFHNWKKNHISTNKEQPGFATVEITSAFTGLFAEVGQYIQVPKSAIGKALAYSIERWDKLSLYITDGQLRIDNNPV